MAESPTLDGLARLWGGRSATPAAQRPAAPAPGPAQAAATPDSASGCQAQ